MLAGPDEKMGTNENFEKEFFLLWNHGVILWKTGGWVKKGQNVCKSYTLSVGVSELQIAD